MAFSLNKFVSEMNKSGFANPSYFVVMITLPSKLTNQFPEFGRSMQFRVESASLPTRAVLTHDQRYYGPIRRIPYGFSPLDLNMTVILSEDMREREVFLRWQDLMIGQSRTRTDGKGDYPIGIFDAGYYEDGVKGASIELRTYATSPAIQGGDDRSLFGELTDIANAVGFDTSVFSRPLGFGPGTPDRKIDAAYTVQLVEPFPIAVNEVPLSWANGNDYAKLNVVIQHRYTREVNRFAPVGGRNNSISDFLRNGISSFNRFTPTLSVIRSRGIGGLIDTLGGQIELSGL